MATSKPAHQPITGGCLCGQIRYTIKFPTPDSWPPSSHVCQCTQCRKASGSLMAPFLNVPASTVSWSHPYAASLPLQSESTIAPSPFREFISSAQARRGFCGSCGSTLSFFDKKAPEEIEIATGTLDEKWLIGDRTERVKSEELARKGRWEEVCKEEGELGKEIVEPRNGCFFYRNAVVGVTDRGFRKRWVENTEKGLRIPDEEP